MKIRIQLARILTILMWFIPVSPLLLCALARAGDSNPDALTAAPTFARDIAPILQKHCQECHRPGQIGPMALVSYDDARPWAKSMKEQVSSRAMPPWHAAPGVRAYANDRSMSDAEIARIAAWVDSGAPRGDDKDLPPPANFRAGWTLGEPDLTIKMDAPYQIEPAGDDEYRCFVLDPNLTEDRWVDAVEVQPGDREIDHHIVLYVDVKSISLKRDAQDPAPGYRCFGGVGFQASMLGGWGPGLGPKIYPEGVGHLVPAGSKIVLQMHYHKNGKPHTDQTVVGLRYAKKPVEKSLRDGIVLNFNIEIPPGDANYVAEAERPIGTPITIYSVTPHMHLLGKSMEIWAELPGGDKLDLVKVPRWDFNWQTEYIFVEPVHLPMGSRVRVHAVFDNSAENPNQPTKPPKLVTFGEQTTDEMCVGVYYFTRDAEQLTASAGN